MKNSLFRSICLATAVALAFLTPTAPTEAQNAVPPANTVSRFCPANTVVIGPSTNGTVRAASALFQEVPLNSYISFGTSGPLFQVSFYTTNSAAVGTNTFVLCHSGDATNFSTYTGQQLSFVIVFDGTNAVTYSTNLATAMIQHKKSLRLLHTNGDTNSAYLTATLTQ